MTNEKYHESLESAARLEGRSIFCETGVRRRISNKRDYFFKLQKLYHDLANHLIEHMSNPKHYNEIFSRSEKYQRAEKKLENYILNGFRREIK
ncbi:hypothetical protein J4474_01590 [Candidatus Pacearchaeota archaeon]|nr:hypothetical protein [Candidatus Pacearchaeota archaeon]